MKGFVIGHDMVGRKKVWKVRVNDKTSELDGKKFKVASTHEGIILAKGLEVEFFLGKFHL
jgi:hypothetical protein